MIQARQAKEPEAVLIAGPHGVQLTLTFTWPAVWVTAETADWAMECIQDGEAQAEALDRIEAIAAQPVLLMHRTGDLGWQLAGADERAVVVSVVPVADALAANGVELPEEPAKALSPVLDGLPRAFRRGEEEAVLDREALAIVEVLQEWPNTSITEAARLLKQRGNELTDYVIRKRVKEMVAAGFLEAEVVKAPNSNRNRVAYRRAEGWV